jgi:tetratricopeptide (TPR) repeat protein
MNRKLTLFFIFICLFIAGFAQIDDSIKLIKEKIFVTSDSIQQAELYLKLSYYYVRNNAKIAEQYITKSKNICKRNNYKLGIALANVELANLYIDVAPDYAYELVNSAKEIIIEEKDTASLMKVYNILGKIFIIQKDYDAAIDYYNKTRLLSKKYKNNRIYVLSLNNLATCYAYKKEYIKAQKEYRKVLKICPATNKFTLSDIYGNIGQIHEILNKFDSVTYYYNKAEKLKKEIKDIKGLAKLYYNYSLYYQVVNKLDSAEFFTRKALKLADEQDFVEVKYLVYINLCNLYMQKQIFDSVMKYYMLNKQFSDSLAKLDKSRTIDLLMIKTKLEKNIEISELENKQLNNRLIISITIFAFFIIAGLFFVIINSMRKNKLMLEKKHIEEVLLLRNREITAHLLNLGSKNELVESLISKLNKDMLSFKKDNQKKIRQIINELRLNLNKDIWKEFELRFTDIHPNFYNNLLRKHPSLTPSELRLCAFLRLNLSIKETALILQLNSKSVERARVRLRRKLGISNQDISLSSYLLDF